MYFHIVGPQHEATQVDGVSRGLRFPFSLYPGKVNVVANALSRNSQGVLASIASRKCQMIEIVGQFGL